MLNRAISLVVIFSVAIAMPNFAGASSDPALRTSAGEQEGSSSDAAKMVKKSFASGVKLEVRANAYLQDALKAIEALEEADAKKLTDVKSLKLIQHLDAVSPPMIGRAGFGEAVAVDGSAARKVWHSDRPMHNHAIFGPYIKLEPGKYMVVYRMMAPKKFAGRLASLDVASHANTKASRNVESKEVPTGKWRVFAIPFSFDKATARVEFRIYQYAHPLMVDRIYLFKVK